MYIYMSACMYTYPYTNPLLQAVTSCRCSEPLGSGRWVLAPSTGEEPEVARPVAGEAGRRTVLDVSDGVEARQMPRLKALATEALATEAKKTP